MRRLLRLIAAKTNDISQWGLAWEYDGFGKAFVASLLARGRVRKVMVLDQAGNCIGCSACARVCHHPCERSCRAGASGSGVPRPGARGWGGGGRSGC